MALGTALFLIAVGAILRFAVTATAHGFNIQTVGLILMIVGAVGLVISLFWMVVWANRRRTAPAEYQAPGEYRAPGDRYYPGQGV
jgi:hypothetical protein